MIIHGTHHKCGTVWFQGIFKQICEQCNLLFFEGSQDELPSNADLFFQDHSQFDLQSLGQYVGSHMIRDPRDVVISGYHYHLHAKEPWLHKPWDNLGGLTFQQKLNSLDKSEGLLLEMQIVTPQIEKEMKTWNYSDPAILELKYEEVILAPDHWFSKIFAHYGLSSAALEIALKTAKENTFSAKTGRSFGEIEERSHLRSGKSGQWRTEFEAIHIDYFNKHFLDSTTRLGYA